MNELPYDRIMDLCILMILEGKKNVEFIRDY